MRDYEIQNVLLRASMNILKRSMALIDEVADIPPGDPHCAPENKLCAQRLRGMEIAQEVIRETEAELLEELRCKSEATEDAPTAGAR